jgi:5-methylthioadenosine/S-adenosylhomocysteine deaminase
MEQKSWSGLMTAEKSKISRLANITGSLTPGKRADLILIRTTDLDIAPIAQIEPTVVQSATPANVDTVMIDGRIIKRAGHLLHFDVPESYTAPSGRLFGSAE